MPILQLKSPISCGWTWAECWCCANTRWEGMKYGIRSKVWHFMALLQGVGWSQALVLAPGYMCEYTLWVLLDFYHHQLFFVHIMDIRPTCIFMIAVWVLIYVVVAGWLVDHKWSRTVMITLMMRIMMATVRMLVMIQLMSHIIILHGLIANKSVCGRWMLHFH